MRIGVLGGTFDPPTVAHLAIARAARQQLSLDVVLLVPTGESYTKSAQAVSPAADRLAMTQLAAADEPGLAVSDIDVRRAGPTYTIDTLTELRASYPPDTEFVVIIGSDLATQVDQWKAAGQLAQAAAFAVAPRSGTALIALPPGFPEPTILRVEPSEVSATACRAELARGVIPRDVPAAVAHYAVEHRLYSTAVREWTHDDAEVE